MTNPDIDPRDFDDVGLPEGEVYPGFWFVHWSGLHTGAFVVKHLNFRLLSGATPESSEGWILDGLTGDAGADFICGASLGQDGTPPQLSFTPDHRGRAHATYVDRHGEGMVTLTSLGHNLIQGLTGHRLDIDRASEWAMVQSLNDLLNSRHSAPLDELSFELEAELAAFVDQTWSIGIHVTTPGTSANILELDGVTTITRREPRSPRVQQQWLDMLEFEGYREFGPLDSSTPHTLPMRSLAAATEAINTPIPLDREFLKLLEDPGDDYLLTTESVPRAVYIAALMVFGANRTGIGATRRSEDWEEANQLCRWIIGLEEKSELIEQRRLIELVFGAVASLSTSDQADTLIDAGFFVALDTETIEARYPGLASQLATMRENLLWRALRDELIDLFHHLVEDEVEHFRVEATSSRGGADTVFEVNLLAETLKVSPFITVNKPTFSDSYHESEYWLEWQKDPNQLNGGVLELDHPLVQLPDVVASIISHTIRHRKDATPDQLSWRIAN